MMRGALSLLLAQCCCCCLLLAIGGGVSAQATPGNNAQRNVNRWGTVPDQPSCGDPALECESEEGGSCQVRLPPPDQTAATYAVWWEQTKAWSDRRNADLATRPFADRSAYDQPELQWAQRNFVQPQVVRGCPGRLRRQPLPRAPRARRLTATQRARGAVQMVHDRYLYDRTTNQWTVDRYLDDLLERYGGIDSVLLWTGYTNIGADERNAFDLFRNLPGGLSGVRQMVARFHARGVAVLWPNFPWDQVRLVVSKSHGLHYTPDPPSAGQSHLWSSLRAHATRAAHSTTRSLIWSSRRTQME